MSTCEDGRYGSTGSFQRPPYFSEVVLDYGSVVRIHSHELAAVPLALIGTVVHAAVEERYFYIFPVAHVPALGVAELPGHGICGIALRVAELPGLRAVRARRGSGC